MYRQFVYVCASVCVFSAWNFSVVFIKIGCVLLFVQGAYPARLRKVLIVTAPLWFKAPFKILKVFVRQKLRDRVYTVSLPQVQFTFSYANNHHFHWLSRKIARRTNVVNDCVGVGSNSARAHYFMAWIFSRQFAVVLLLSRTH